MAPRRKVTFETVGLAWSDVEAWVTVPFRDLPWSIAVRVAEVDGVPQIIGLRVEAGTAISGDKEHLVWGGPEEVDPTITTDLLRQLPMRQLLAVAVKEAYEPGSDWLEPFKLERTPGQPWSDEHYQAVAEVYRNADRAPLNAIKDTWNVSRAAASKWVAKARELGYLGYPQRRGVAGASASRSPIKRPQKRGGTGHGK